MKNNHVSVSFLQDYKSLSDALIDLLGISKNQLKKSSLPPKVLKRYLTAKKEITLPIDLVNHGEINSLFVGRANPIIISMDQDFIVLSKPFKVHCHPHGYLEHDNLLSYMYEKNLGKDLQVNNKNYDRGLLYRIDYETSGLILYIRDNKRYQDFRENFKELVKQKKYLAVVEGECQSHGELAHDIRYSGEKAHKGSLCNAPTSESFHARCIIEVHDYNKEKDCSLVELTLFEGLRHQLRLQMMAIGHPIIGDPLYGKRDEQRMFLHCWKYKVESEGVDKEYHDPHFELLSDFFSFNS